MRNTAAVIVAISCVVFSGQVDAGRRATQEEIRRQARPLEEYLEDVTTSCAQIDALIIAQEGTDMPDVRQALVRKLEEAEDDVDRAVLRYLIARTHYWSVVHKYGADDYDEATRTLAPLMFEHYFAAVEILFALQAPPKQGFVAGHDICDDFARVLSVDMWLNAVPTEVKDRAIRDFIVPLEKTGESFVRRNAVLARAYRKLGVEDRLKNWLPDPLPVEPAELVTLVEQYRSIVPPEFLVGLVDAVEGTDLVNRRPDVLVWCGDVCLRAGLPERAEELHIRAAKLDPKHDMDLALLYVDRRYAVSDEDRRGALARYFSNHGSPGDYIKMLRGLYNRGSYSDVIQVVKDWAAGEGGSVDIDTIVGIESYRALALNKMGRKSEAIAELAALLKKGEDGGASSRTCDRLRKAIADLGRADKPAGTAGGSRK